MARMTRVSPAKRKPGRRDWKVVSELDGKETTYHGWDQARVGLRGALIAEIEAEGDDMLFVDFAGEFMIALADTVTEQTMKCHRWVMRYLCREFQTMRLRQITQAHIVALRLRLLSLSSVFLPSLALNLLGRCLSLAQAEGYLSNNPCDDLPPPPLPPTSKARSIPLRKRFSMPSMTDFRFLVACAWGPAAVLIYLGLLAGLRIGEVVALSWGDIDLVNGRIHVWRTAFQDTRSEDEDEDDGEDRIKTLHSERWVPILFPALTKFLAALRQRLPHGEDDPVAVNGEGYRIRIRTLRRAFHKLLYELGLGQKRPQHNRGPEYLGQWCPHALRHAFVAALIWAGAHREEVSCWIGHKHIDSTLDLYGGLFEQKQARAPEWEVDAPQATSESNDDDCRAL